MLVQTKDWVVPIEASGVVQAVQTINLSPSESGRIAQMYVTEGDRVAKGQIIARMDSNSFQADVDRYRANLIKAEASLAEIRAGTRPEEIAEIQARVNTAAAEVKAAEAKLYRAIEQIQGKQYAFDRGAISRDRLKEYTTRQKEAAAELEAKRARLKEQQESLKKAINGDRPSEIASALATVKEAQAQLDRAQNNLVVVLGPSLAEKLFENENPLGQSVQINNLSFQVIGITKPKDALFNLKPDEAAYIPITTMTNRLVGRTSPLGVPIDSIEVKAKGKGKESLRSAAFQASNILTRRRGKKDFQIGTSKSFQQLVAEVTSTFSLFLVATASISLLVGGISIMNIMLVSVTERTKEIGLRKAIGATEQAILTQFLIEGVILAIAGGLIGTGIGVSGTIIVTIFTPLQPTVPLGIILLTTGISGTIGLIFGVTPARRAARLDPIIALRGG